MLSDISGEMGTLFRESAGWQNSETDITNSGQKESTTPLFADCCCVERNHIAVLPLNCKKFGTNKIECEQELNYNKNIIYKNLCF